MKHVLVIDGGGIKGKYSLGICDLIAQHIILSERIHLVVGVSVGAWIAALIAFGYLDNEQSRRDVMEHLNHDLGQTFETVNILGPLLAPKYDGIGKRKTLEHIFGKTTKFGASRVPLVILCATLGGSERVFESWNPDHKDLSLVELLDATSAIPVYFPAVVVHYSGQKEEILVDGGIISNKPLELAYVTAQQKFGDKGQTFNMLSLGTQAICELKIENNHNNKHHVNELGLLSWAGMGLFDIAIGVANSIPIRLMIALLGEKNFLRLACECALVSSDKMTPDALKIMNDSIASSWTRHKEPLLTFLA